jgi:transposase
MSGFLDSMPTRMVRALEMLRAGVRALETKVPGEYLVPSQSGQGFYRVRGVGIGDLSPACECDDFLDRLAPCKHVYFAQLWILQPGDIPTIPEHHPSQRRRVVDWPIYNRAQTEEERLIPNLLKELCAGIPEPERNPHQAGRPPTPLRDQYFCAIEKVRSGKGCRRSAYSRVEFVQDGRIDDVPGWTATSDLLRQPEVTPVLLDMVARSVLPLRAIENRCAVDKTGLRTTLFHYYKKERYTPTRENIWLGLHALVGIRTHAILSAEVTAGSAADGPVMPLLLERAAAAGFRLQEILADKAYGSRRNFSVADEYGALLFSPPKSNATGVAKGSPLYHKMYHYFLSDPESFERHYGDRAQAEAAFSSFKQVLGETIRSRTFDAQRNEVLCKVVSHNLRMLVHAMLECGVLPDFLAPHSPGAVDLPVGLPVEARVKLSENFLGAESSVGLSPDYG